MEIQKHAICILQLEGKSKESLNIAGVHTIRTFQMHRLQNKENISSQEGKKKKLSRQLTTKIYGADKFQERLNTGSRKEINPTKKGNQTFCFKDKDASWGAIKTSFLPLFKICYKHYLKSPTARGDTSNSFSKILFFASFLQEAY